MTREDTTRAVALRAVAECQVVEEITVDERRGWCVAGCGCALDVPPDGAVFVDCAACAPGTTPTPASGDRPAPGESTRGGDRRSRS